MFRVFLSWRYLCARRTNIIGILGIFVGVAALILIISIMSGFLEQSRKSLRGSLSDIIIEPALMRDWREPAELGEASAILELVRADERVRGACAQIVWYGLLTGFEGLLSSQSNGSLLGVQLVGVDLVSHLRVMQPALRAATAARGGILPPMRLQDEYDATDFLVGVLGGPSQGRSAAAPVDAPLFPFQPPADYAPRGRPKAAIVVGDTLFRNLSMRRGDELQIGTVVTDPRTREWSTNNREFVVAGSFRTGENEADVGRIYMARSELFDFLGAATPFTQVLLELRDYDRDSDELRDDLRLALADAGLIAGGERAVHEVATWEDFRGSLLGAIENERFLMGIMLSLVLIVSGFTVFAIISMMVTEKRRDVGILCALGATPEGVLSVFLMIAFWDALVGALLGAVLGTWAAIKLDAIEQWLSDLFGYEIFNRQVYVFDHIPTLVDPLWVGATVFGAFVCALLFAAFPAWRASRLDPLEALRYE